ncbi:hypothetical protein HBH56_165460 [Parastagonospora nodorum]|nr:hypothetical protein HBH56_165460 [Parastagonospora nodorum]KAH4350702.1 hypothetical protein HBH98_052590 [Parastagonospora nodorum]KAH4911592.1 hypothetical protein HBI80_022610 [Parastagonospora nodorum]KAH5040428.1 hypothetical protein HBI74_031720 [Parastagonospora nodorum]KAH5182325.1 hypothetical protein HBH77_179880 [Parastagonospora nodorum]
MNISHVPEAVCNFSPMYNKSHGPNVPPTDDQPVFDNKILEATSTCLSAIQDV